MPWRETAEPVRMERVALLAPLDSLRPVLVAVADSGAVELDRVADAAETAPNEAARRLQALGVEVEHLLEGGQGEPGPPAAQVGDAELVHGVFEIG